MRCPGCGSPLLWHDGAFCDACMATLGIKSHPKEAENSAQKGPHTMNYYEALPAANVDNEDAVPEPISAGSAEQAAETYVEMLDQSDDTQPIASQGDTMVVAVRLRGKGRTKPGPWMYYRVEGEICPTYYAYPTTKPTEPPMTQEKEEKR